jgi:exodeoxyribonuclease VII large subunit
MLLQAPRQRLDYAGDKLSGALYRRAADARHRFAGVASRLTPRTAAAPLRQGTERLALAHRRLARAADGRIHEARGAAERAGARLAPRLLERRIAEARAALAGADGRKERAAAALLAAANARLSAAAKLLSAVSYQAVLRRGFALVRRESDEPVRAAGDVGKGEALQLEFADGRVKVVEASAPPRAAKASARGVRRSRKVSDDQGVLF